MTDTSTADAAAPVEHAGTRPGGATRWPFFGSIGLFVRQVVAELRKVVRPTRNELITYTSVVLVFVARHHGVRVRCSTCCSAKLVLWVFGG